jgi:hypothetical protein
MTTHRARDPASTRVSVRSLLKQGDDFVDVAAAGGRVADRDYIEGAIELSVGGRVLLSQHHADYIDQLWAYLVDALILIAGGENASTFLPDQPIEIVLVIDAESRCVSIRVGGAKTVTATADLTTFLRVMTKEARRFFDLMQSFVPQYTVVLDDILRLERIVGELYP